jgi:hypothetical protein
MSNNNNNKRKTNRKGRRGPELANARDIKLPLTGFRSTYVPDMTPIKLVYSDYRTVVATATQGEYVYRANSCFDCDLTGAGGQPDGFDLWKTLYESYRVVAVKCEVQASVNAASGEGLVVVAASPDSAAFSSAEEVAGFRKSMAGVATMAQPVKLKKTWHISELVGVSDATVLSESNFSALIGANPGTQQYIHVCTEMSSASGEMFIWTKLTYYTRMEQPDSVLDAATRHRLAFSRQIRLPSSDNKLTREKPRGNATPVPAGEPVASASSFSGLARPRISSSQLGNSPSALQEMLGEITNAVGSLAAAAAALREMPRALEASPACVQVEKEAPPTR